VTEQLLAAILRNALLLPRLCFRHRCCWVSCRAAVAGIGTVLAVAVAVVAAAAAAMVVLYVAAWQEVVA
jgi:hypothetical protein